MGWCWGLTELDGVPIGRMHWPLERKFSPPLNGMELASFQLRLDDTMAQEISSRLGNCLVKIYQDSTLMAVLDIMDFEEIGPGGFWKRIVDRKGMVNHAYVLDPVGTDIRGADDPTSINSRGEYQEVIPADFPDSQLRQALAEAHVRVRKVPRQRIDFDPSGGFGEGNTMAVNCAGPLWRLSKKLIGTPPGATSTWTLPADEIIEAILAQANLDDGMLDRNTKIRWNASNPTLYPTVIDDDPSWAMKPVSEALTGLQEAKVPYPVASPPTADVIGQDDFSGSGALDGVADDSGNTWNTFGDTTDFSKTGGVAVRNVAVTGTGRWALNGEPDHINTVVGIDWSSSWPSINSQEPLYIGVIARHNGIEFGPGTDEWIRAYVSYNTSPPGGQWVIDKRVSGVTTQLASLSLPAPAYFAAGTWYSMRLLVDDLGNYTFWHYATAEGVAGPVFTGRDTDLATGGGIATGKSGWFDRYDNFGGAIDRSYDNFVLATNTGPQAFDFEFEPLDIGVGGETDIAQLNLAYQLGTVRDDVIFEQGRVLRYGEDYERGDFVVARAKDSTGAEKFNAQFRIYNAEITIDEQGKETHVPMVTLE